MASWADSDSNAVQGLSASSKVVSSLAGAYQFLPLVWAKGRAIRCRCRQTRCCCRHRGAASFQGQGLSNLFSLSFTPSFRGERDPPKACRPLDTECLERRATLGVVGPCDRRFWAPEALGVGVHVRGGELGGSERGPDESIKSGPPSVRGMGKSVEKPKV